MPEDFAEYLNIASRIANARMRGRTGFGGLSRRRDVLANTLRLMLRSQFSRARPQFPPLGRRWHFHPEEFHYFIAHEGGSPYSLFTELAANPGAFDPPPIWALFWAAVEASGKFHDIYVPYWSHEERLTGHLVTQLLERIDDFHASWASLADDGGSPQTGMRLAYFDTAASRREALTGADLGLVIHGNIGGSGEFFKVVKLQAKKANAKGKCRIDLDQIGPLTSIPNLGYHLFYHFADATSGTPAPTVCAAAEFMRDAEAARKNRPKGDLGSRVLDVESRGWDFATFLAFGVADPQSDIGALARSPREAMMWLLHRAGPSPTRVAVLSLGNAGGVVWPDFFGEDGQAVDEDLE